MVHLRKEQLRQMLKKSEKDVETTKVVPFTKGKSVASNLEKHQTLKKSRKRKEELDDEDIEIITKGSGSDFLFLTAEKLLAPYNLSSVQLQESPN
ncbi:3705_t:CDS:2 [Ambispora gerdemannii]|uniref:3705_t:CDS:1 n=1 Tax=Ambispora gerdemannii TaxID=144530 RepID=A0A9N8V0W1_9GLOM|nr:3705_t:CDS:2 [Ambispora gerdemannii]